MSYRRAIAVLPDTYSVGRFIPDGPAPVKPPEARFVSITWTDDEVSVIGPESMLADATKVERGYRVLRVAGPIPLDTTGVLAEISRILAAASISIFPIATYATDYVLVKEASIDDAVQALRTAGWDVTA